MSTGTHSPSVRLKALSRHALSRFSASEEVRLLIAAALIGIVTAGAAVAFHELIGLTRGLLYERLGTALDLYGRGIALLIVFPAAGGLVVGLIARYIMRTREGHGVVDVIESVIRSRGYVKPIAAVEKILTSAITIGSGGSAGAEGPIVQIGAAIASGVGRLTRTAKPLMPLLVGAGSAAGISAIFNSPFGGVLFTLEVILQEFSLRTFTPVVLASVVANVTTQAIFRRIHGTLEYQAIFAMPDWEITRHVVLDWGQMANFVLLGGVCGAIGVALIRAMYYAEGRFSRLALPRALKPALGAALLGITGVVYIVVFGWLMLGERKPFAFEQYPMPAFFGNGYGVVARLLQDSFYQQRAMIYSLSLLAFLCVAKIVGTCLTLGSGGSGGVIAPSLFIGSTAGAVLGLVLQSVGWNQVPPEVYALVGMGAVLAAVVHAPLASILIVFELTQDTKVILPAMLACIFATTFARFLFRDSIYTLALRHRGVRIGTMADLTVLRRMTVEQVELAVAPIVQEGDDLRRVLGFFVGGGHSSCVVVTESGQYSGMVTSEDIKTALFEPDVIPLLVAGDVARREVPVLSKTDDLATVLDTFALYDIEFLPVSDAGNTAVPTAIIARKAVLKCYQQELGRRS